MKRHIILIIAVFISFVSCKQTNSNSLTNAEMVVDTLSNDAKCKVEVKKDVELLLDSVLEVKNDTLYFRYKAMNSTSRNLLFFHFKYFDTEIDFDIDKSSLELNYPNSKIHIINSNNKLPRSYRSSMGGLRKEDPDSKQYSYILLRSGESKSFYKKIYIGNLNLFGDSFKLKLRYSSPYNEYFISKFKKMQSKNPKLKDYERFEGVIESNECFLTLH